MPALLALCAACSTDLGIDENRYACEDDSECGAGYSCQPIADAGRECVSDDEITDSGSDATDATDVSDTSDSEDGDTSDTDTSQDTGDADDADDANDADACQPQAEICDGLDNDCDGDIDEDFSNLGDVCSDGIGACQASGEFVCTSDGSGTECNAEAGTPGEETCGDGEDNDCDDEIDETCECTPPESQGCYTGASNTRDTGECDDGSQTCKQDGSWGACENQTLPSSESCDGLDNDCDGDIDEDFSNKGATCTVGTGQCQRSGTYVCRSNGNGVTCNATPGTTSPETCDGLDNDCDGDVDEGVKTTYYYDGDGDGYGVNSNTRRACTSPANYVAEGGDCADGDSDTHPYAATNEPDPATCYTDMDGDGWGSQGALKHPNAASGSDCNDGTASVRNARDGTCDRDGDGCIDCSAGGTDCNDEDAGSACNCSTC